MKITYRVISIKVKLFLKRLYIQIVKHKYKKFGKRNYIWAPVIIIGKYNIEIGSDVVINSFTHIWGHGGIVIGDRVMIAAHTVIASITHDSEAENMRFAPVIKKKIVIEDDVWIGSGAKILPGITLGKGCIVGAGAIVTKDIPANAVAVGAPAKVIRYRK